MVKKELICTQDNIKLETFLRKKLPDLSFGALKKALNNKDIKVNGTRVNANIVLHDKDNVVIFYLPIELKKSIVVYEDENIKIVNKPEGMNTTTIDNTEDTMSLEQEQNAIACHRLDRNTSGLVVMAKTTEIEKIILDEIKQQNLHKYYLCLVNGNMQKQEDILTAFLQKDEANAKVKIFDKKVPNSVEIITKYSVIKRIKDTDLLQVELMTGKTHQIRAHLSHIGHFIIGDNKYGNKQINKQYKSNIQLLTAYKLQFTFQNPKLTYLNDLNIQITPTWLKDYE